jgi:hypothetical protein
MGLPAPPDAYFANPTAWESASIGDGPFEVVGQWQPTRRFRGAGLNLGLWPTMFPRFVISGSF